MLNRLLESQLSVGRSSYEIRASAAVAAKTQSDLFSVAGQIYSDRIRRINLLDENADKLLFLLNFNC